MKSGLLAAAAAALGLVGGWLLWMQGHVEEPAAGHRADAPVLPTSAPASHDISTGLSTEAREGPPDPGSPERRPAIASAEEAAASGADGGAPIRSDLAPLSEAASGASPASLESHTATESERFARKYAGIGAYERTLAREDLEAMLAAHKDGTEEKGQALTPEQLSALDREIAWLRENP